MGECGQLPVGAAADGDVELRLAGQRADVRDAQPAGAGRGCVGQIGNATEISVVVDTLAPTDMWSNYQSDLQANHTFSLLGHGDDEGNVPLPARPYELANAWTR